MSCEQAWWDYVGAVNAHTNALDQLARHAGKYIGWGGGLIAAREIDEWVQYTRNAQATLTFMQAELERYYDAMKEHGKFAVSCRSGDREHDL